LSGRENDSWRHHFVGQHYLKAFTESIGSKYLWSYEKGTARVGRYSIRSVGFQRDLHTIRRADGSVDRTSVENEVSTGIEQPAIPILEKIRAGDDIAPQEKWTMARYMCSQIRRVPRKVEKRRHMAPKVISDLALEIERVWPEHLRDVALKILNSYTSNLPDEVVLRFDPTPQLTNALFKMTWVFLVALGDRGFITSDDPVSFDEGIGVRHMQAEVTLPISTRLALWATWNSEYRDCRRIHTTNQMVDNINERTVLTAAKHIFYCAKEQWATDLAQKRDLDLEFLNRQASRTS
jgi:hypothetical protein